MRAMGGRLVGYILGAILLAAGLAISLMWRQQPQVVGGSAVISRQYLDWETRCLPAGAMRECLAALEANAGFGPPTEAEAANLAAAAANINRRHGVAITADAMLAMRRMEAALAGMRAGVRAQRHGQRLLAMVAEGKPIVEVAAANGLPPLAVLRQVLIELGWAAGDVKRALADKSLLPGNLANQLGAVLEADLSSAPHSARVQLASAAYEKTVGRFLSQKNIKYRTEEQLRGSSLTPDFLLDDPVIINESPVYWIDAKNYPMWGSRLVAAGIAKQARKYTDAFGPGAFVFSGGVMCDGKRDALAGPLLLDGSQL